jgi:hypothetical protein
VFTIRRAIQLRKPFRGAFLKTPKRLSERKIADDVEGREIEPLYHVYTVGVSPFSQSRPIPLMNMYT